jgi:hypothetical protein
MEKITYDVRGSQSRIFRLLGFDKEAFIHMLFYRILLFVAIITGMAILFYLAFGGTSLLIISDALIAAVWILFTPQLFESAKAFSIISSKGESFGHLNKSFLNSSVIRESKAITSLYNTIPYLALVIWVICFFILLFAWFR